MNEEWRRGRVRVRIGDGGDGGLIKMSKRVGLILLRGLYSIVGFRGLVLQGLTWHR
jgi:hypothetical protein